MGLVAVSRGQKHVNGQLHSVDIMASLGGASTLGRLIRHYLQGSRGDADPTLRGSKRDALSALHLPAEIRYPLRLLVTRPPARDLLVLC